MEFSEGVTVFAVDLKSEGLQMNSFAEPMKIGRLSVHLKLEKALTTQHSLFCLGFFEDRVIMNSSYTYSTSFVPGTF